MNYEKTLFAEIVESIGRDNFQVLGNDAFLFSKLKNYVPMGLTKPYFISLPVNKRLDYPHDEQIAGPHLSSFLEEVHKRFKSAVGKVVENWILAGDGATENAYQFPDKFLTQVLEVFMLYPNSVIAVQPDFKSGIFLDMTWSATIFSSDLPD